MSYPTTTTTTMTTTVTLAALLFTVMLVPGRRGVEAVGYSYARFVGPVIGPERRIVVPDRYQGPGAGSAYDYVAQPKYHFAYGVEDRQHNLLQNRRETRNGDTVHGMYSVYDPNGVMRVVKYTANDKNGFQAEVISNGVATAHGVPGSSNVLQHIQHETRNAAIVQPTATAGEQSDEDTASDTKDDAADDATDGSDESGDSSDAGDHRGSRDGRVDEQGSHEDYEYASYDGYSSEDGDNDGDGYDDGEVDESSVKATRLKPSSGYVAVASPPAYSHQKASR